jgi:predicted NAD/FAD-binding protein
MLDTSKQLNIAVVGAGVAGISAAHLLQRRHSVTLFERNDYFGGHTHTVEIPNGPDAGTPVDTGFIVFNNKTYPNFIRFLEQLGVPYGLSDMSFSFYDEPSGLQYAGSDLNGLFADRLNLFRPSFWRLMTGIIQFCRRTQRDLHAGTLAGLRLADYCRQAGFADCVVNQYILPMASAIWSTPMSGIRDFPMESFAHFYENHGLLSLEDRPTWFYVKGGSRTYVETFLRTFKGKAVCRQPVRAVEHTGAGVRIALADGSAAEFDRVVLACHADESLALLRNPKPNEAELLGKWKYSRNRVILHADTALLPPLRRAWASWNYFRSRGSTEDDPAALTYHMNRLQQLGTSREYCVTLNPRREPAPPLCTAEFVYDHPIYNFGALATQSRLQDLNREGPVHFCGSYFGYGFHEDAVRSSVQLAGQFGISP